MSLPIDTSVARGPGKPRVAEGTNVRPPQLSVEGGRGSRTITPAPAGVREPLPAPATGRSWTLPLPVTALLNANQRPHWTARHRITKEIREAAAWTARAARVPPLTKAHIICEIRFANAIRRDVANWSSPSAKAAIDGLVDAGVLPDDDALHLIGPDMRLGPVEPGIPRRGRYGRLVLHVYEITEGDG